METNSNNIVDIQYEQTGTSSSTNELGMREMQARAYEARNQRFLLIKAPPASGKSRALMFIALDKLAHQGIKKVVVAVPEKSIGRSFNDTNLKEHGFFADWKIAPYFNLCDTSNEKDKADASVSSLQIQKQRYCFALMPRCVMPPVSCRMTPSTTVCLPLMSFTTPVPMQTPDWATSYAV